MKRQAEHWDRLSSHPPDASVIDPGDRHGRKNRYITGLRDEVITSALAAVDLKGPVLDFGCGTGSLSRALVATGRSVVGVDISSGLLGRTVERGLGDAALFVRYDGLRLPIADSAVAAVTTYVVLNHVIDDKDLRQVLRELRRVLMPGGLLVAVEQVRTRATIDLRTWQHRRTPQGFAALFAGSGLVPVSTDIVRYGRMPTTYALRYGLLPETAGPRLRRMERLVGRAFGVPPWDYCDVRFVLEKR